MFRIGRTSIVGGCNEPLEPNHPNGACPLEERSTLPRMAGAIAAGHPLSARAGADVLAARGSAIDAVVAAALAAFVTEGPLTGPAGGGFLLYRPAAGESVVLDCFFAVPSIRRGAMEEVVIDFGDASTQTFYVGEESVAVPGLLAGLGEAHRRWGRLRWTDLVEPAIALARAGIEPNDAQRFLHRILVPILQREVGGRRVYGDPDRVHTEELVPALGRLRDEGPYLVRTLPRPSRLSSSPSLGDS